MEGQGPFWRWSPSTCSGLGIKHKRGHLNLQHFLFQTQHVVLNFRSRMCWSVMLVLLRQLHPWMVGETTGFAFTSPLSPTQTQPAPTDTPSPVSGQHLLSGFPGLQTHSTARPKCELQLEAPSLTLLPTERTRTRLHPADHPPQHTQRPCWAPHLSPLVLTGRVSLGQRAQLWEAARGRAHRRCGLRSPLASPSVSLSEAFVPSPSSPS